MGGPLDDVQDTPWGQKVDDSLRVSTHEISVLRAEVKDVRNDMVTLQLELKVNTRQTDSIKRDTQWLVDASKGGMAWGKLLVGLAIILGAIAAFGVWLGWGPHE